MWVVYGVLFCVVIGAHVLMFFVIRAGIREAEKHKTRQTDEQPLKQHWLRGFGQPFEF